MRNQSLTATDRRHRRRRRGTARLFVLSAAFAATATGAGSLVTTATAADRGISTSGTRTPAPEAQDIQTLAFSIQAQPLGDVIAVFEQVTGIKVVLRDEGIGMIQSPGVTGTFTVRQALQELLTGTSVAFTFTARNTVTLDLRAPAEFVTVTGARPALTSPKFTEPLRDIPQTVTVVPASVIEAQGATTLRDVLRNVTGISIQAGEGGVPAGDNLSIRGFSARTDLFIDGVRDAGGYTRDPFNIEQVEVMKGPSSAIAGRGSTGGAINMATKAPHLAATRSLTIGIGSSDYKRSTLDVNQPFSRHAAVRINGWRRCGPTRTRRDATRSRISDGASLRRWRSGSALGHASRSITRT